MPNTGSGTAAAKTNQPAGFRSRRQSGPAVRQPNQPAHQSSVASSSATPSARSAPPLPKRNKGRFFVGSIFVAVVATILYAAWTTFFQYQSYGVIQGRLITVSSPWNGVIVNWRVKEGQEVVQGQPVAEIANLEMRHQMESLHDELRMNQAQLDAASAKLKFETQNDRRDSEKAYAEYLQSSGELAAEQASFEDLNKQLERAKKLRKTGNFSQQKFEKLYFDFLGQKRKIEKLKMAVDALRNRYQLAKNEPRIDRKLELQPMLARIDTIQSEIQRIREKIQQGMLRAPVGGRVTKRLLLTGESVQLSEPVVEILEDNSTEAILYVPQEHINRFEIEQSVSVELPPFDKRVECQIVRLGNQLELPPPHIAKYYSQDSVLLPVYLMPLPEYEQFMSFRINGIIKLPIVYKDQFADLFVGWKAKLHELFASKLETPDLQSDSGELQHVPVSLTGHSQRLSDSNSNAGLQNE